MIELEKYELEFPVSISSGGETSVMYAVNPHERYLLDKAMDAGDSFEDYPGLKRLYKRIAKAAREQIENDLDFGNESGIDPDDVEVSIGFPE